MFNNFLSPLIGAQFVLLKVVRHASFIHTTIKTVIVRFDIYMFDGTSIFLKKNNTRAFQLGPRRTGGVGRGQYFTIHHLVHVRRRYNI